ncbi:HK97 family phage prohead protease [Streptomyces sp. L2]|uniref:HK97 family phage prohead protease n=1 Tax=Streptomyces sp. L2 TaxID=2162665 RepID=UPI001011A11F|nr:HK97 family phage prohead protease [Streptomyces sp. L2]
MTAAFRPGGVELRTSGDITNPSGDGRTLVGYAARFHEPTIIREMGVSFREQIMPGAFTDSLSRRTPLVQYAHGTDPRVGTLPIAAMQVAREDAVGLWTEARLFESDAAQAVREAVAAGAIGGQSFRFRVISETWQDANGRTLDTDTAMRALHRGDELTRSLQRVDLFECGPVLQPAYTTTTVGVRSAEQRQVMGPGARASYLRTLTLRAALS